jgi:urea transporter
MSLKAELRTFASGCAEIVFLRGPVVGAILFAATWANPRIALSGALAVLAARGLTFLLRLGPEWTASGSCTYNPLLVGCFLGWLLPLSPPALLFIAAAGILTVLLTVALSNVFTTVLRLPILSLPFVAVSTAACLAVHRCPALAADAPGGTLPWPGDMGGPDWMTGFFRAFGAIFFVPSVATGLLLSLVVLYRSRILFLLAVVGYAVGVSVRAWWSGSWPQALADLNGFNFMLVAMAVGGVFRVPSAGSYLLAAGAVVLSAVVLDAVVVFGSPGGIPAFTLPFNLVTLGVLYVLGIVRHPMLATPPGGTPEETLENHVASRLRYPGQARTLGLPFAGPWTVWQGFDGTWTHQGRWRHACDFVILDEQGRTHRGDGSRLEDYYAYRKPVLSPVRGRVARVVDDLPDSPVSGIDEGHRWGNLVVLQDDAGFFVEISHLASHSVRLAVGDRVERGTVLGFCGNSGYSPQPHIHVQVQADDAAGAASLPFSFASYAAGGRFHANNLPREGERVEPLYPEKRMVALTGFLLDEVHEFEELRDGQPRSRLTLTVKMAPDGTTCFDSGRGRLYFGRHEGTFYFYRVEGSDPRLRRLFLAMPRLPLAFRDGLTWCDFVPVGVAASGLRRLLAQFLGAFYPALAAVRTTQVFLGPRRVACTAESALLGIRTRSEVELDETKGIASIRIGRFEFRRVRHEVEPGPEGADPVLRGRDGAALVPGPVAGR